MPGGDQSHTKIEPNSPYYLGPQDKPGDSITPIRLTPENYNEWSHDVRVALKSRRKFVFVNGAINEPQPPCTEEDWDTIHSMLVSWLTTTLTPEVKSLLPKFENAKQLWDALQERFGVVDGSRIQQIIGGLRDCRQGEDLSITGLNSAHYSSLRSVILAQTLLPTVARAYHMLCQEERVRGIGNPPDPQPELASFHVGSSSRVSSKPPSQMTRTERQALYCNHSQDKGDCTGFCFAWQRRGGRTGTSRSRDEGGFGRVDSTSAESGQAASSKNSAAAASSSTSASLVNVYGTPQHDHSGKWLIDTGCSHHVTGNLALLSDVTHIPRRIVGLPNGTKFYADVVGRVTVTPTITLNPVLYVPQLTCNLISASQLSDHLNCEFVTNSTVCTIQDRATREEIGTGKRLDGLYYLQANMDTVLTVPSVSTSFQMWHHRLGHPSEEIIKLLPFLNNKAQSLSQPCEVCHRAKQIRSTFPLSSNNRLNAFELIHCDLWGPYDIPSKSEARYFLTLVDDFSRGVWIFLLHNKTEVP
ncbi:hypothetical protein RND81_02G043900 [Saponaria officinalis]|uniref:GAG-pre-integrase domain-containing protein n=1 Tax=Saponaria officinalis TaxID=3572 RepID=A0AAW1MSC0_SAPOF